jgi:hypothetical protein
MHSVLPFKSTVHAIANGISLTEYQLTAFCTTVWEDNAGALVLANMELGRMTS